MTPEERDAKLANMKRAIDHLIACLYKRDYDRGRYDRGEYLQKAACDNLDTLMLARHSPTELVYCANTGRTIAIPRSTTVKIPIPSFGPLTGLGGYTGLVESTARFPETAILEYVGVRDDDPGEGVDPLVRAAVVLSGTERICIRRRDTGKWILWFRSKPPGPPDSIDPDVAYYLEGRNGHDYIAKYSVEEELEEMTRRYNELAREPA